MSHQYNKPQRVSKAHPCPICKASDWCLVGDKFILCMRVHSSHAKVLNGGETGWLHPVDGAQPRPVRQAEKPRPVINSRDILDRWSKCDRTWTLDEAADSLGVSTHALVALQCIPSPYYKAFAFPMRSGDNGIVGIRLRSMDGKKWAEPGSNAGLFIPQTPVPNTVFIVEGPTDSAALMSIGFFAIGRPSCSGGVDHLKEWFKRHPNKRCVVVADVDLDKLRNDGSIDNPGIRGAKTLIEHLSVPTAMLTLPAKDSREFVVAGGTPALLNSILNQLVWKK